MYVFGNLSLCKFCEYYKLINIKNKRGSMLFLTKPSELDFENVFRNYITSFVLIIAIQKENNIPFVL